MPKECELEVFYIELLELYYKKYTDTVQASDYVAWATHYLYIDVDEPEINKLASMSMKGQLNIFEIEKMFDDGMNSIQQEAPSKEKCFKYYINGLHAQLLVPVEHAMSIVNQIYNCTLTHDLFEEQMKWLEISDAIDDFQYGSNYYGYTIDKINEMIVVQARRLWHTG